MNYQRKLAQECSIEELDRELIARGAKIPDKKRFKFRDREGTPERTDIMAQIREFYENAGSLSPSKDLCHLSTWELAKSLMYKSKKMRIVGTRGIWDDDNRRDFYLIEDERIKGNVDCTAAVCRKDDLIPEGSGFFRLKTKKFGEAFNLCDCEPFYDQPIAAGRMCTGFLVKEDIIATADHCLNKKNITDFRFVFGFKMIDFSISETIFLDEDIYIGVNVINRVYRSLKGDGSDWALVQLDRKVVGQAVARLSSRDIFCGQPVYVIGHPCGLPLKYAAGASVKTIENTYFAADLDVYSGNSGSPVFNLNTHELVGIVVRGDNRDFRWTGRGWMSVIYPNPVFKSSKTQCTRVSEFIRYCR